MKKNLLFIFTSLLSLFCSKTIAQKITGVWEGNMRDEYIQVNVEQRGTELCGFTYDYVVGEKANHCVAKFEGRYSPDKSIYFLKGNTFIENSGSHVFMQIVLWRDKEFGSDVLIGKVYTGGFLGVGGDNIKLRKVSSRPQPIDPGFEPCFPPPVKPDVKKPQITQKPTPTRPPASTRPTPVTPKPKPDVPPANQKPAPVIPTQKDTPESIKPRPKEPLKVQSNSSITENMKSRKKTEQSRLEVDVKTINLKVYDNGIVDDDTVSIFFNGKLLLSHQRLSEKPIEFNIELDPNLPSNEITMFAENLGSIPPNTALIVITAGAKRYELRSKADLQENAVLVIEYKPKE